MANKRPIMSITGSDSIGQSGIQADISTIMSLGGVVATAITSVTVQTTLGIQRFFDIPAHILKGQIEAIFNDVEPAVVKIGLLRTREAVDVVAQALRTYAPRHVVYAPHSFSTVGEQLSSHELAVYAADQLVPLSTLVVGRSADEKYHRHGVRNVYSSAAAFFLNEGLSPDEASRQARLFLERQAFPDSSGHGRSGRLFQAFVDVLARHYHEATDVQFYADRLLVSPRYLSQVTHQVAGKSPKLLIDERVVEELKRQLRETSCTMQEIALRNGFSSQSHFSRYFKNLCGVNPTTYRKQSVSVKSEVADRRKEKNDEAGPGAET